MKTIPVLLSDDLHKKFRTKLFQDGRTVKEFFLTSVADYVKDFQIATVKPIEKPENPVSPIEVHRVDSVAETINGGIEPENKSEKIKEQIDNEEKKEKPAAGTDNGGAKKRARKKKSPRISRGGETGKPTGAGTGKPRRKRGLWPWVR